MKKSALCIAMVLAVAGAGSAWAHGARAQFGGVVKAAGNLQFELVNKNGAAVIYVAGNHGEKFSTAGMSGTLTVENGTLKTEVPLAPASESSLETKGDAKLVSGAKVTAALIFADKQAVTVSFIAK
ncbi:MAG: hypothetical protein V4805_08785 [Pseudomonadota bacterium]